METPSQSAPPGFAAESLQTLSAAAAPVDVEMVLRVWTSPSQAAGATSAEPPGLLSFIEDVAAAGNGVVQTTRNQLSISGFKQPADAMAVARQIQLGLQGFRGQRESGPVAVSIAIDAASPRSASARSAIDNRAAPEGEVAQAAAVKRGASGPSHDLITLLKIAKPAQVLLTHDFWQRCAAIKGLPLKSFPARFGVYEYLWTTQERLDRLQSEPQLTLAAVAPAPSTAPEKNVVTAPAAPAAKPAKPLASEPERESPPESVRDWRAALRSPRFAVFAGLAVAVIGLATFVGVRLTHESTSTPAPVAVQTQAERTATLPEKPATPSATPQSSPASVAENPAGGPANAPAQKDQANKQAARKPEPEKKPPTTPASAAVCILQGELSRYVVLAEHARGRGDYSNAIRRFREILACDPNNGAAQQGLNRAIQGQAQSR